MSTEFEGLSAMVTGGASGIDEALGGVPLARLTRREY